MLSSKIRSTTVISELGAGGGGGIRTLEGLATLTVFETVPFNHSGTPPPGSGPARVAGPEARRRGNYPTHRLPASPPAAFGILGLFPTLGPWRAYRLYNIYVAET